MTGRPDEFAELEVRIEATPQTVFGFFTDPARMLQWMGIDAAIDPRPGGAYRVSVTGRETAIGEFVELTPYERIVMTWGWDSGPWTPGSTRIEIDLIADGEATILRLRHYGLDAEGMALHEEGWNHYLARLAVAATGSDPGADEWATAPPN
jgi:uncharacterized protein YndB with AHSA1/START domain